MKDDWTPIGDEVSYGHDIELSWLLVEAAEVLGDPALIARARAEALQIARVTNRRGRRPGRGRLQRGRRRAGRTNTNKEWWEQAEAAVGFLNAYQISGDPGILADVAPKLAIHPGQVRGPQSTATGTNLLRRDGTPIPAGAKVSIWKCPYHSGRSCMELIERVRGAAGGWRGAWPAPQPASSSSSILRSSLWPLKSS